MCAWLNQVTDPGHKRELHGSVKTEGRGLPCLQVYAICMPSIGIHEKENRLDRQRIHNIVSAPSVGEYIEEQATLG